MTIATPPHDVSGSVAPDGDLLAALRPWLTGELVTADSPRFDELRKVPDITVDRCPLAIVHAANTEDVAATVRFARAYELPLAVRSGGHSVAHHSMIDGAIVVDLSGLKRVSILPQARIARVQAGATSRDVADVAHAFGLALSTGDTAGVGMGGLATGGGIGLMVRKYGLAIDNLLSARVVTANGDVVTASPDEHPDLFWAIRGGGGNFGVVTELEFRLAPVEQVLGGVLILPASREVIRGYLDYTASAPDDLTTIANLMHVPPLPFVPPDRVGDLVLLIVACWTGSVEDGERALAPLRSLATPIADLVSPIPYPQMFDFTEFGPHAASVRMMFANDLADASIEASLDAMERVSSPLSVIQLRGLGGQMAHVGSGETAFAHRDRRYVVSIVALWTDAAEDADPHRAWVQSLWEKIRHEGIGTYVNFLEDEGEDRVREAYPAATFARLAAIKRQYDPENLFRFNQNIPPRP
jgi:FAD/FMN-containing dehydrogenase